MTMENTLSGAVMSTQQQQVTIPHGHVGQSEDRKVFLGSSSWPIMRSDWASS